MNNQPKPLGHLAEVDQVHAALNRELDKLKAIVLSSGSNEARKEDHARKVESCKRMILCIIEPIQDTDAEHQQFAEKYAAYGASRQAKERDADLVEIEITH